MQWRGTSTPSAIDEPEPLLHPASPEQQRPRTKPTSRSDGSPLQWIASQLSAPPP
ncbi:hypothetical protein BJX68DRAFT_248327 [Aspergillus pseudodeflectus]|uniref:Uncharacterized protein n=1 Tax=Aspergillus pseudodeflectus TaxID=176178 RepID=A0ABR4JGR0_9EURO